jgi:CO/xanthine dehydrogenase Mo-binding subunit
MTPAAGQVDAMPGHRVAEGSLLGRGIPSTANAELAAGRGTFVNDLVLDGMAWMAVLRSPYPHARIRGVDPLAAWKRPGVLLVLTGRDIADTLRPIPCGADNGAMGARSVEWHALAGDRVRYVGEAVAVIVAEDRSAAYAALDDIEVDYEELPAVVDPMAALTPGSPLVEPAWGENVILRRDFVIGEAPAVLARAAAIERGSLRSSRISGAPIEPRARWRAMTLPPAASPSGNRRSNRTCCARSLPRR